MRRLAWAAGAMVAAVLAMPFTGLADSPPRVVFAVPGSAGGSGGVIDRFTVRFSEPMVPLGDPRAAPPIKMACKVAGNGRWADERTFVHEFDQPLPGGLTCEAELRPGLASARGVALGGDSTFKIDTGGPSARAVLPSGYGDIEEDQVFLVSANIPPSSQSVATNAYCAVEGIGERIPADVQPAATVDAIMTGLGHDNWRLRNFLEESGLPQSLPASVAERRAAYAAVTAVKCRRPLPPGKDVALVWGAGIQGPGGRLAGREQRFDFTVRKAFAARYECSRVNPNSGCMPIRPVKLRFSADIPMEQAMAVRLVLANGKEIAPGFDDYDRNRSHVSDLEFKAPFPASTTARIILPADVRDESGRPLTNAARFPLDVRIDAPPPLVKFAADFGIIEAREGGVLPVTVRAVEADLGQRVASVKGDRLRIEGSDGEIAKWLRDIDRAGRRDVRTETRGKEEVEVNYTGATSLLAGRGQDLKLALPGKGREFEVVGIPLAEPGFYVVELASPVLGEALLGRKATRYVAAGALVTNMSVHFKWGREGSLAWVTALDTGQPVAGADVRVTDACSGRTLASGVSDKAGRLFVRSGLPQPETYTGCDPDDEDRPLMVSARKDGDFSFTLTDWGSGIRPYDFDLPYGWSAPDDIVHTIFDRTLVRQGESVNMKHILRKPVAGGFAFGDAISGTLKLTHAGSDTAFEMPVSIGRDGIGESRWDVPKSAPMGDYSMQIVSGDKTIALAQTIKVDEYRLPTMRATVSGPKTPPVRPQTVPLNLFVGYFSGGGAGNLPVNLRTAFASYAPAPEGWEGWSFGGRPVKEGTVPLNEDGEEAPSQLPLAQTLPVTLGADGTAQTSIPINMPIEEAALLTVEMDYQDANGETLTASRYIQLLPSAVRLGVKTDGWLMRDDDLRLNLATIDAEGRAMAGRAVNVELYTREVLSARRRLIGGFYAYDNQMRTKRISGGCAARTDKQGLASCQLSPGVSGEVTVVATTRDADGNVARAVTSVWLAGQDEWWFGGDNGDRMDLVPEAKSYKAGETARFQVRMPFREATALVTVEREGVVSSFVTPLKGTDPVIKVPMPGTYAPEVYVSVLAVRGRVSGTRLWLADTARKLGLGGLVGDPGAPTALVDLAKPAFRIGIARVKVGWEANRLGVKVKADRTRYGVRETANVDVAVTAPGGKPARTAEIAFAAVDEALLSLQPNDSWQLLEAMMVERPLSVLTSTGQTQVVGKRHYGRKAAEAGGGGGNELDSLTRSDFRPVLLWRGRVTLDEKGRAQVPVQLSDSLSAFRLVAVASDGTSLFGAGETTVRTAQDLQIFSGLPPLVRSGDVYGASFTLRNGTDRKMRVEARARVNPAIASGPPLTVDIPPGGAVPVTWHLTAPEDVEKLDWTIVATEKGGKAADRIAVSQAVAPAVPLEVWGASLARAGTGSPLQIAPPDGALPGKGFVDIKLSDTLAPPLAGVRAYMARYPYGCFEQRLSKAVVLGDRAAWDTQAAEIPVYLDGNGLLRYFPMEQLRGSEALTAYVLSMTAEAGWPLPADARAKMIAAMRGVAEGRLANDDPWTGDARLLRIAALAALARNGASTPAMLNAAPMAAADMPTGALTDWLAAIDRTPGTKPALRQAAEQVLRQRLVFEGSRLDLADAGNAPWWMMSSTDEMAIKALLAVLGRPGWDSDGAKMMVGVALRQHRGRWDTTPANAWGTIAAMRFARLFPASAITGTTSISLGGETRSIAWPLAADAAPVRIALPAAKTPLVLSQRGGAGPWATVSVQAAVPLSKPLFAGYRMARSTSMILQQVKGQLTRGDVMRVTISVDAPAERNWVVIDDPIPPGATIIGGLGGQSALLGAQAGSGEGVQPSYVERGNDAWRAYFQWVPRGRFAVEYAVRLNGVGQFSLPPSRVEALYSPEIRAALPVGRVEVKLR